MSLHPRQPRDLMLAPVAATIDLNLQRMRGLDAGDVEAELELELDAPGWGLDRRRRADLVLRQALRCVDLHGWTPSISDDATCLRLTGGSVSIQLGLSAGVTDFIEHGVGAHVAG